MNEHTPGPWKIAGQNTIRTDYKDIPDWQNDTVAIYTGGNLNNARLIAAAPKMYGLLMDLYDILQNDDFAPSFDKIKTLLKQIDGEETN